MGTDIKKIIDTAKSSIEVVGNKVSFSANMNTMLEKISLKQLSKKEIKEIKIDSYNYNY
jgi:hypothetical protein